MGLPHLDHYHSGLLCTKKLEEKVCQICNSNTIEDEIQDNAGVRWEEHMGSQTVTSGGNTWPRSFHFPAQQYTHTTLGAGWLYCKPSTGGCGVWVYVCFAMKGKIRLTLQMFIYSVMLRLVYFSLFIRGMSWLLICQVFWDTSSQPSYTKAIQWLGGVHLITFNSTWTPIVISCSINRSWQHLHRPRCHNKSLCFQDNHFENT